MQKSMQVVLAAIAFSIAASVSPGSACCGAPYVRVSDDSSKSTQQNSDELRKAAVEKATSEARKAQERQERAALEAQKAFEKGLSEARKAQENEPSGR
jgi:hypothetical protein